MADIPYPPLWYTQSCYTHAHMPIIDIVWGDVFLSRAFMILNVSVDGIYTSAGRNCDFYFKPHRKESHSFLHGGRNNSQPGRELSAGDVVIRDQHQHPHCPPVGRSVAYSLTSLRHLARPTIQGWQNQDEILTYRNGTGHRVTLQRQPAESGTAERLTVEHRTDEH
ncbi:hypothetical protein BU17DRAFT_69474 [Hysterangium stoloniferum]|nr:hypothetical protein BU17DRAFT_69474 [Hysterangium stoloniferum]